MKTCLLIFAFALAALCTGSAAEDQPGEHDASGERENSFPALAPLTPAELLASELTRERAVQAALQSNARLQAVFAGLGVAQADLEQAGLYANPGLELLLRFPEGKRRSGTEVELTLNLAELWQVPLRRSLAEHELRQATLEVLHEVLLTSTEARTAHDACVVLGAVLEERRGILEVVSRWRDQVHERFGYGYSSDLDLAQAEAELAQAEAGAAMAETELALALARLRRLLGLPADAVLRMPTVLPGLPVDAPELAHLLERALARRPDLLAARAGVTARERRLALERRRIWSQVALGPSYSSEPGSPTAWGVKLEVELPLFDDNRAQRRRAASEADRARGEVLDLEAAITEQVTAATERMKLALRREALLREKVLPARERAWAYAVRAAEQMQFSSPVVLTAERALRESRLERLFAAGEVLAEQTELEYLTGGRLAWDQG